MWQWPVNDQDRPVSSSRLIDFKGRLCVAVDYVELMFCTYPECLRQ